MSLARARALADAVLLEGYCLYPYRASALKNRGPYRWQFGVLAPRRWSETGGCEPWWLEVQCLLRGGSELEGILRFLSRVRRRVERGGADSFEPVESIDLDGELHVSWDEAELREVPIDIALEDVISGATLYFERPGLDHVTRLGEHDGAEVRVVRRRGPVAGRVRLDGEDLGDQLTRLRIRVECITPWSDMEAPRDEALSGACLSTHLLLEVPGGSFISLQDPPPWAGEVARSCKSVRSYPVLAGEPGRDDLLLCAPIILYDHAQIAPESQGNFFDATEIDELLTLRTAALTPEEKRHVRATDSRAAEILDRVEHLPPADLERLHGAAREVAAMPPRAAPLRPGVRVRLRPGSRRTDAQDLLYAGRLATVEKVLTDVDGDTCLAVTLIDDPAAELHRWYGRFHYYYPDEVELAEDPGGDEAAP